MTSQKTKFTRWLTACFAGLALLSGCGGREVTLGFPLVNGNTWAYQGTITYKIANQEQSMPPLTFTLRCRQMGIKANSPLELILDEEGEPRWSAQLTETPKGIANPLVGELWLPVHVKMGKKWSAVVDGLSTQFVLRSETSTTVPAGTFPTYLINFKRAKEGAGSLWLDPAVGIISFTWTSKTQGGESTVHLDLASSATPED